MKTEGKREEIAYIEAKKAYLNIGKKYSSLLSEAMKLDPNILKVAESIMLTGDNISIHDNRFLVTFYNELKNKSKIDKKYYELLLALKKTKNELDHASHDVAATRVSYLLRKSGIPPRRTNHGKDIVAIEVNDPDKSIVEKISLPEVLDLETSETLENLILSGELECVSGELVTRSKAARDFVKSMEKGVRKRVNNDYFMSGKLDLLKKYHQLTPENVLDYIRATADEDHIREIERRLEARDIKLTTRGLVAVNPKGKKYLALLLEELSGHLDKKLKNQMLEKNKTHVESDSRVTRLSSKLADLDISIAKHAKLSEFAGQTESYQNILINLKKNSDSVRKAFADLLVLQETISTSYAYIKKQLALVVNAKQVSLDKVLSLVLAVRYLSVYELRYEKKLTEVEAALGIINTEQASLVGPLSLSRISETYRNHDLVDSELDLALEKIIRDRLAARREFGVGVNDTIVGFVLNSPKVVEYKHLLSTQNAARKHIVDTLYSTDCLYRGIGNISEILAEITELEIEKKEKLTDLEHELELAHKELWLAQIKNRNNHYIDSNFTGLKPELKDKAKLSNKEAISSARKEIKDVLGNYRAEHKKHSEQFAQDLRDALQQISKGGDVGRVSAELKAKYKKMLDAHDAVMKDMEKDIIKLEKRLLDFGNNSPKEIEKMLICDIRNTI